MRTPVVAANWKMNTTIDEAKTLVSGMKSELMRNGSVYTRIKNFELNK